MKTVYNLGARFHWMHIFLYVRNSVRIFNRYERALEKQVNFSDENYATKPAKPVKMSALWWSTGAVSKLWDSGRFSSPEYSNKY